MCIIFRINNMDGVYKETRGIEKPICILFTVNPVVLDIAEGR